MSRATQYKRLAKRTLAVLALALTFAVVIAIGNAKTAGHPRRLLPPAQTPQTSALDIGSARSCVRATVTMVTVCTDKVSE